MLVVGGLDARGLREVQPADDADALRHVLVHTRQLVVAGRAYQRLVKRLVHGRHRGRVAVAVGGRHQPQLLQSLQQRAGRALVRTQALHRRRFQQHAQVVELVEAVEVEGQHAPAGAEQHLHETLLLQADQRLAHRRARHVQALAELVLGEAVAGQQVKVGDVALELLVHLVGARRRCRGAGGVRGGTSFGGGGHEGTLAVWDQRGCSAVSSAALEAVQPTMAPCAAIISSVASRRRTVHIFVTKLKLSSTIATTDGRAAASAAWNASMESASVASKSVTS